MDSVLQSIQKQLDSLHQQMYSLEQTLEKLPDQLSALVVTAQETKQPVAATSHTTTNSLIMDEECHAFLLDESLSVSSQKNLGQDITPEVQVQRLTAQLTAAYNRIAALEEQLLAQRMSH